MDKFRALEYFVAAAEEGSLSGAARRLEVTIPAALKIINGLERNLGTTLFDRSPQGLALTADGARYLDSCRPLLQQLADADAAVSGAGSRPRGTLVVGAPAFVQHHSLLPALPRFRARYPDIDLDLRVVNRMSEPEAEAVDVFVLFGWHEAPDMIHKRVAQTRYHVCAAPSYWAAAGTPARPSDLARHECLAFRNPQGTLLDFWEFDRGKEHEAVSVRGWLASGHRDVVYAAALAGEGVVRITSFTLWQGTKPGDLVPVLEDWKIRHSPPVSIFLRPKDRRNMRVRVFADFFADVFRRLEEREAGAAFLAPAEQPEWYYKRYGRASRAARVRA